MPGKDLLAAALFCASLAAAGTAQAQAVPSASDQPALLEGLLSGSEGRLLRGFHRPGFHVSGGLRAGLLLGIDGGPELGPTPDGTSRTDLTLGGHLGYAFGNGLALIGRFDALGTRGGASGVTRQDQFLVGARYAFIWVVCPFVEAELGLAHVAGTGGGPLSGPAPADPTTDFSGSAALGVLVPLGPYFAVALSGRDWLTLASPSATQTVGGELGFEFTL